MGREGWRGVRCRVVCILLEKTTCAIFCWWRCCCGSCEVAESGVLGSMIVLDKYASNCLYNCFAFFAIRMYHLYVGKASLSFEV